MKIQLTNIIRHTAKPYLDVDYGLSGMRRQADGFISPFDPPRKNIHSRADARSDLYPVIAAEPIVEFQPHSYENYKVNPEIQKILKNFKYI